MDFSLKNGLQIAVAILVFSILLYSFSVFLITTGEYMDTATTQDSYFNGDDINKPIEGINNPKLTINDKIKIKAADVRGKTELELIEIIRNNSNIVAKDYKNIDISSSVILEIKRENLNLINDIVENGGIIVVKYSVEDSVGRKTSIMKNVIIEKDR